MNWTITLEGQLPIKADDVQFVFKDISKTNPRALKASFIQELFKQVDENPHYTAIENVKEVINSEGKSLPHEVCAVLFFTEKDKQKKGIAFYQLEDGNLLPIGLWPNEFAEAVKTDFNILQTSIAKLTQNPKDFIDARLILPIKLGQEPGDVPERVLWSVVLEGEKPGPEDDWVLEFADLKYGMERPKSIPPQFATALLKASESHAHYKTIHQIKQVQSNMNESIPVARTFIIYAQTQDEKVSFNLLFHIKDDGNFEIIGIWPPPVVEMFQKNEKFVDMLLLQLTKLPDFFKQVAIFIPIQLKEELISKAQNLWIPKYTPEGKGASKEGIQFIDCLALASGISLLTKFFSRLKTNAEKHKHYLITENITEFDLASGQKLTRNNFSFVFTMKKDKSKQGLLFKKEIDRTFALQGIWPESFLDEFLNNDKILFEFIDSVVKIPETFKEVKLYFSS